MNSVNSLAVHPYLFKYISTPEPEGETAYVGGGPSENTEPEELLKRLAGLSVKDS